MKANADENVTVALQKPSMGILKKHEAEKNFQLLRYPPAPDTSLFVKHYWIIRWDLAGQASYMQDVVPNPCVNLVIEPGKTAVYAPAKQKYSHLIEGKGLVFGVKFKPGGFYPFIKQSVTGMSDKPMKVEDMFDTNARDLESSVLTAPNDSRMVELVERMIRQKLPAADDNVSLINQMIDLIIADKQITKVDHLLEQFDMNKRKLQRLFEQYVGVNPKWVIKLYRLQNAAETADLGLRHDWAKLSADLGYYDQSHFIRDFKAVIGKTPDEYARL